MLKRLVKFNITLIDEFKLFVERFKDKKLESICCPTCGPKAQKKLLHLYEGIGFYCCKSCNLNFASPRLIESELHKLYEGDDWRGYDNYKNWNYVNWVESNELSYRISRLNLKLVERFLKKDSRILDVGCDIGLNIKLLNENGYPSKGVEISSISSRIANEIIGVKVENTELKDFSYQEKFEGVMLMDVLEHLYDPIAVLKDINIRLNNQGLIFINVPHHAGISASWKKFMHKIKFKKSFKHFGFPAHLYGFDKQSLNKMLSKSGFKVLHFESWPRALTRGRLNVLNYFFVNLIRKFALSDYIICVAKKANK